MNQVENQMMHKTAAEKFLDLFIGFLGSLVLANIGLVLIAQFDTPERIWILYFTWFWRFAMAGLAIICFTRKRIWISMGLVAAILLQAFGI